MELELAKAGMPYEFIEAVDGRLLGEAERSRVYSKWRTRLRYGVGLTSGELGCVLSHIDFFRRVLASYEGIGMVLEDDVALGHDFAAAVQEVAERLLAADGPTLIQLPGLARDLRIGNGNEKFVSVSESMGTYAYAINRSAAALLIKAFSPVMMPIDYYRYVIKHYGLNYFVYSRQVLTVNMDGESMVGSDRKRFTGLGLALFRVWRCFGIVLDRILTRFDRGRHATA